MIERPRRPTYTVIALLGHPIYYPRFGFRPGHELGIETTYTAPPEAWMVLPLPAYSATYAGPSIRKRVPLDLRVVLRRPGLPM